MKSKQILKRIANITVTVLVYLFLALCLFAVIVTAFARREADGTAQIFGYQFRIVTSESMAKCDQTDVSEFKIKSIPLRSMIIIETVPSDKTEATEWYASLKEGDVLTFRYVYDTQVTITHRIVDIRENGEGGYYIDLEGDNKYADQDQIRQTLDTSLDGSPNHAIGKVVGQSHMLGLFLTLLKSKLGIILIIMIPCILIISLEVFKIVKTLTEDKRKRDLEEHERKDNEIRELRRQIAELQNKNTEGTEDKTNE